MTIIVDGLVIYQDDQEIREKFPNHFRPDRQDSLYCDVMLDDVCTMRKPVRVGQVVYINYLTHSQSFIVCQECRRRLEKENDLWNWVDGRDVVLENNKVILYARNEKD